jgi:hypothetical protein
MVNFRHYPMQVYPFTSHICSQPVASNASSKISPFILSIILHSNALLGLPLPARNFIYSFHVAPPTSCPQLHFSIFSNFPTHSTYVLYQPLYLWAKRPDNVGIKLSSREASLYVNLVGDGETSKSRISPNQNLSQ